MDLKLDFASDDKFAGFRLNSFELYNWGTYNKSIVKLNLNNQNALLTGDIGSGKSTIVDALTTLLVPYQKIIYNKAAGADSKERSLYSYIVGEYKSSQDENFGNSKAVALRDEGNYSVILGHFENEGFNESLILAQFFYINNHQVNKFFIISQNRLSIKKDFFDFKDVRELKKRLRSIAYTDVYDSFKDYFKSFKRILGIKNEQALNLFYQTVSLKSIGNLTEFIRVHMLEEGEIQNQINELCVNFADLNCTHELVLKAKKQIALLEPIEKNSKIYTLLQKESLHVNKQHESLEFYFSLFKKELLEQRLKELEVELQKALSAQKILKEELKDISQTLFSLKAELKNNGGDRIEQIKNDIKNFALKLENAKEKNLKYNLLVKELGMLAVSNEHRFLSLKNKCEKESKSIEDEITSLENTIMYDNNSIINYKKEKEEYDAEIAYLQKHPSNICLEVSKIRDDMALFLHVSKDELPFVGELISVKDERWNGAIERVLRSFALSLIVDKTLYEEVSEYVNKTNLKGRLIYLKVDKDAKKDILPNTMPNSMLEKLELKIDSPFFEWLNCELNARFNIPCVQSLEEFRRFKKALSITGQFKSNLVRHEKDDRFDINDTSKWVLGWDNALKLSVFEHKKEKLEDKIKYLNQKIQKSKEQKIKITNKRDILRDILKYESFEEINWYRFSSAIESLEEEKRELEKSNDIIKSLQESIKKHEALQKTKEDKLDDKNKEIGRLEQLQEDRKNELKNVILVLENSHMQKEIKETLDSLRSDIYKDKLNLNNINQAQNKLKENLNKTYKNVSDKIQRLTTKLIQDMNEFLRVYPSETKDFDASIQSINDFNSKLAKLKKDNLPKWQKKFKELLKEKTIHGIVMLQSQLEYQSKQIEQKIDKINISLKDIEYNDGTFIELIATKSNIAEIKEFKQTLKAVTSGAINDENSYNEEKFLQIKELISRFNGRENFVDIDKKWRRIVSDVRNWFDFSATEKYISDESQKEFYAHSGGKSGGQKEKLAYTVLASSLAYQFGLEHDKIQSRSFRFVMIDEAFGRGSDESTRYALRLFEKLKLQLLVITPKQKINVIEPYVKSVHFVYNEDGMDSSLISMEIEEYQKNKHE